MPGEYPDRFLPHSFGITVHYEEYSLFGCNATQFRDSPTFRRKHSLSLPPACAGFLLGLLFNPEEGGDMFVRNLRLSLSYKALQLNYRTSTIIAVKTSNPTLLRTNHRIIRSYIICVIDITVK
jgi:hypothetical protein